MSRCGISPCPKGPTLSGMPAWVCSVGCCPDRGRFFAGLRMYWRWRNHFAGMTDHKLQEEAAAIAGGLSTPSRQASGSGAGFCPGAGSCGTADRAEALCRSGGRRSGAGPGMYRGDGHRRGQDPDGHHARGGRRLAGAGLPHHHGQRLPGQARCRMDGPDLSLLRAAGRVHRAGDGAEGSPARLLGRYHLLHEQGGDGGLPAGPAPGGPPAGCWFGPAGPDCLRWSLAVGPACATGSCLCDRR